MKKPYKEPVFLFTSSSMRFAAWAGWYSARGEVKETETWIHQAHTEWAREMAAGRRFDFLGRFNHDMYDFVDPDKFKKMLDKFLREIKKEVKVGKEKKSVVE